MNSVVQPCATVIRQGWNGNVLCLSTICALPVANLFCCYGRSSCCGWWRWALALYLLVCHWMDDQTRYGFSSSLQWTNFKQRGEPPCLATFVSGVWHKWNLLLQEDEDVRLERRGDLLAPLKVTIRAELLLSLLAPCLFISWSVPKFRSTSGQESFGQLSWLNFLAWPSLKYMVVTHQIQ